MTDGVWKGLYSWLFGRSCQLSLYKFFDPSTPSMRKGCNGDKKGGGMMFIVATSVVAGDRSNADRLERCTLVPIR